MDPNPTHPLPRPATQPQAPRRRFLGGVPAVVALLLLPAASAFVIGGMGNFAPAPTSVVVAGTGNGVLSIDACIVAGLGNFVGAGADQSCIAAGTGNVILDGNTDSFIGAGVANTLSSPSSCIGAGLGNGIGPGAAQSCIAAGDGNAILAGDTNSFVGAGVDNTLDGTAGIIGSGIENAIGPALVGGAVPAAVVAGGRQNSVFAEIGAIGGGESNTVNNYAGTVPGGEDAVTASYGELAHGSGGFGGVPGTAQHGTYIARRVVTGTMLLQPLFLDGAGQGMNVPDDSTWAFEARVVAQEDNNGPSGGWVIHGVIENPAGPLPPMLQPLQPVPGIPIGGSIPPGVWLPTAAATPFGLEIQVTQVSLSTAPVRWVAVVETTEVAF